LGAGEKGAGEKGESEKEGGAGPEHGGESSRRADLRRKGWSNAPLLRKSHWDPALRGCEEIDGGQIRQSPVRECRVPGRFAKREPVAQPEGRHSLSPWRKPWEINAIQALSSVAGYPSSRPIIFSQPLTHRALSDPTAVDFFAVPE